MMKTISGLIVLLGLTITSYASEPTAPRTNGDCKKTIAFSVITNEAVNKLNSPIIFGNSLLPKYSGYDKATGIFTTFCPGLHQFSFSASGENIRISMRRRPNSSTQSWTKILSTGDKGGSHTILIDLQAGEQIAIYLEKGFSASNLSVTFNGIRLAPSLS